MTSLSKRTKTNKREQKMSSKSTPKKNLLVPMFSQSFSREGLDHENGKFLLKTYRFFPPSNKTYSH